METSQLEENLNQLSEKMPKDPLGLFAFPQERPVGQELDRVLDMIDKPVKPDLDKLSRYFRADSIDRDIKDWRLH